MEKIVLSLPAMYADHHVTEVRRILMGLSGVTNVFASSAFHSVEIAFDPALVSSDQIYSALDTAGYVGDLPSQVEALSAGSNGSGEPAGLRHTMVYEQTKQYVSFTQNMPVQARPLWPCPGMGVIRGMDDQE
jgi:copper chaperone CopZ